MNSPMELVYASALVQLLLAFVLIVEANKFEANSRVDKTGSVQISYPLVYLNVNLKELDDTCEYHFSL